MKAVNILYYDRLKTKAVLFTFVDAVENNIFLKIGVTDIIFFFHT